MTIYRSHLPDQPVPYMNAFSFAISNPNNTPDSYPILIDGATKQTITFGQWKLNTLRWATALQKSLNFKRGDVLALFSFNQIDYSITMFGPLVFAGITTTVNSAYNADELAYQLRDSGATAMVTHPELLAIAREGARKVGLPEERIFLYGDGVVDGFRPYTSLLPPLETTPESELVKPVVLDARECKETTALICYSSGTTGRSKGVELSHLNFTVNAVQVVAFDGDLKAHDNIALSVLPMYHM
jgi:acyl-CoA synthetase (AMP-forming)/AMP-acid ligase II